MWHLLLNFCFSQLKQYIWKEKISIYYTETLFFTVLKFYNFSPRHADVRFWQLSPTIQMIAQYIHEDGKLSHQPLVVSVHLQFNHPLTGIGLNNKFS